VTDLGTLIAFKLYSGGAKSQLDILELLERNPTAVWRAVAIALLLLLVGVVFVTAVERRKLPPAYQQRPFVRKADIPTQLLSTCRQATQQDFAAMEAV